jgi:hypothetical protein
VSSDSASPSPITPSRAYRLLSAAAADALTPMREQLLLLLAGITEPVHPAAVLALHDRIRSTIERCVAETPMRAASAIASDDCPRSGSARAQPAADQP